MTLGLGDLAFVGSLAPPLVWNAGADLAASLAAGATNPNGRWSYGMKDANAVFSLITNLNASGWFGNQSFNTPFFNAATGGINSHVPIGMSGASTIRWTAPSAMTISVDLRVVKTSTGGNGIIHRVALGGTAINTSSVIQGPTGAHEYLNTSLAVTSGQHLDFDGDRNADDGFDSFRYDRIIITQVG